MIQLHDLSVRYGDQPILRDVSLRIEAGEFVLVSGPSGCGKSTLALCLAGLIPQEVEAQFSGRVLIDGLDTSQHPVSALAQRVGLVFQNPATQLFNATVAEEVAFGPRNLGLPADQVAGRVEWAMEAVGITHLRGRPVRHLSAGEQQRVAIAAVLAMRPAVLVLDEPTANLDWHGVEQIADTLARLHQEEGLTVVLIEHRLAAVAPLATRVVLMDAGPSAQLRGCAADGAPQEVLGNKQTLAKLGLRYPWLDAERRLESAPAEPMPSQSTQPLVQLREVTAGYGRHTALSGLNLALYPGQFVALVGDNGAGKSTVARLLAGILRPQRGQVIWHPDARRLPPGRRTGLLFQNPLHQLVCDRVDDEVAFGPHNFRLNGTLGPLLAAADLTHLVARRPGTLSVGQQQRTALAAALALQPRLLILDEPTMGQDWAHLSRLMDYLTHLHSNGQTILLITHDDRLVYRYARHVIRLSGGRVASAGAIPRPEPLPPFPNPTFTQGVRT